MTIHIINGPNLNLLGVREPEIYGHVTFNDYMAKLRKSFSQVEFHYFQSNHEGDLIDRLQEIGFKNVGIIMNPAAYTHTSIAIADTVKAISAPVVEVHISNVYEREPFRHHSYLAPHAEHRVIGQGLDGYKMAVEHLLGRLRLF